MEDLRRTLQCVAFVCSIAFVSYPAAQTSVPPALQSAPENSWVRLNTNYFSDAWAPDGLTYFNTKAVIEAWSSFAWDSTRGNIILWGGGHANYAGNEVYLWSSSTGQWSRGSLSSMAVPDPSVTARYETIDGPMHSPISMHTYDGNIYLPRLDRFLTFGGPQYNQGGAGADMYDNGTLRWTGPYLWDPAKADPWKVGGETGSHIVSDLYPADSIQGGNMWENRDSWPQSNPPGSDRAFGANFTAYADENGKDVIYLSGGKSLWRYTINDAAAPAQDQYELVGIFDAGLHPHGSGTFDHHRRMWVEIRGSDFVYYDISGQGIAIGQIFNDKIVYAAASDEGTFNFGSSVWPTIGDRYAIEYDPLRDRYLIWEGTNEIWQLHAPVDLASGQWILSRLAPTSTAAVYPDRIVDSVLTDNGYYAWRGAAGKWKYVPQWDAFVGIYHPVNGDVWAYKPQRAAVACDVTLSPTSGSFGATGGDASVSVVAAAGCAWTAENSASWLGVTSGSAGSGNGSVSYSAAANAGPARSASLTIGGRTFVVNQESGCAYSVSPAMVLIAAGGGTGSIAVTTNDGCGWNAVSDQGWLAITSGQSGSGSGVVGYSAVANSSSARSAVLSIGGSPISVSQSAPLYRNVALQANGGVASASSWLSGFVPAAVNNGDRKGADCTAGGCWLDGTEGVWPDWVQVTFSGSKAIDRVEVFTMQDNWQVPVEPTPAMTFSNFGVVDFQVQYWTGSAWVVVPNGVVTGNNKVWRTISFPALTTDRIRVWISQALWKNSRITEIEAWGADAGLVNVAPTVSLTAPVVGASYVAPASVTLTAVAADSDGSVAKVEFYAGATKLGEVAGLPYTLVWSGVVAGTYSLTAVATDNLGATTTSAAVGITVTGLVNVAPTVSLTAPVVGASYVAPASVTLTAVAADSDGSVAKVEFYAGATKLGEVAGLPYTLVWSGVAAGTYSLTAVATDNLGATTTSAAVGITVTGGATPINVALQANGGVASASSWLSGFVPAAVNNGDRKGADCTAGGCWLDGTEGVWPDWVQVTFSGSKAIDRVEVFTMQDNWQVPVEPTPAMTFSNFGVVDFQVQYWTGSAWVVVPNGVVTGNNKVWRTISFPALTTDRIRVWISQALWKNSRITEIEAWGADAGLVNVAPTVSLTAPVVGASYVAPASVTLTAVAADSDGSVAKVEFYAGATKLGEVAGLPYTLVWSGVVAGTYSLTAVATDNLGATTTSAAVGITVTGLVNVAPTVSLTAPVVGASYVAPASVTLTAVAADSDGSVAKVEFYAGATKLGEVAGLPYTLVWSGVAAGTYSLTAVATDNLGATTTSAAVGITVTGGATPINVALQANGGVASASSWLSGFVPAAVNNGDRKGADCTAGGCWLDGTEGVWPDWVQVTFSGSKAIDRVEVFTMQDNWQVPVEPTPAMTFSNFGVVDFQVQYWTGSAWVVVPNGVVTGNNKVWRTISFPALTTDRIRVWISQALWKNSRITEIEAWGADAGLVNVAPTVSLTAPVVGASYVAPASVTLTAVAADSDGSVAKVEFYAGATKLGEVAGLPYTLVWSGVVAGTYSLTAVATDNLGATTTSAAVGITVTGLVNVAPTVSLTAPVVGASYVAPASVTLTAVAADSDGSVAKVEFYAGATKLGEVAGLPYTLVWSGVAAGTYSLTAVATDNLGATTTSAAVGITVTGGATPINVALQANGGVASASSWLSGFVPAAVNNGDRKGADCTAGGCWLDGTEGVWPDWVQVTFSGSKAIDRVEVFTMQDNWQVPVEPTPAMTFSNFGVVDFQVQYWTGSAWVVVPNGVVTGNNKVWRTISFPALTTDRIRVWISQALWKNSRITEIEAWTVQ